MIWLATLLFVSVVIIGFYNIDNNNLRAKIEELEFEIEDLKSERDFFEEEYVNLKDEMEDMSPYVDYDNYANDNLRY